MLENSLLAQSNKEKAVSKKISNLFFEYLKKWYNVQPPQTFYQL